MRKIERLRIEALATCKFRGHKMEPFSRKYRHWWNADCKICGRRVYISDEHRPNGNDIDGEAVALDCNN